MINSTSIPPDGHAMLAQQERVQTRPSQARGTATGDGEVAGASRPPPPQAAPAPLVPDMSALPASAHTGARQTFDISAESLSDLLARINITGAGVATRMADATRRVQIASLGARSAETALVAQLRIAASPYSPAEADPAAEAELREALAEAEQAAAAPLPVGRPSGASTEATPAAVAQETPVATGQSADAGSAGAVPVPSPGTLVDVVG